MNDDELLAAFDAGSLTPATFGHREHVRLAWLHVTRLPLLQATRVQSEGLRRLTAALGVPGKYHATITIAWLLLIHERATGHDAPRTWPEFAAANRDLFESGGAPLAVHYSSACLASPDARTHFVPPDLHR